MKIAVASDDGKTISSHFGRTRGFAIFDIEDDKIKGSDYRDNTFTGHAMGMVQEHHSHNHHSLIIEALSDCTVVISHGMGRMLYDDLKSAGMEVFVTDETDAGRAVALFIADKLTDNPGLVDDHRHR
ncbi:MAG: NifB/NifX family molybdenum-iron cluster-binding protein [Deltaproteobacteria bacterium]|nr:NifB/NifX family molybdenum-iron cluster-binding protein [Deltaproteobacteria bacterium]MCL5277589.1 NifB/NifX family molybdenum-iron cluster-binding protein [Deltaproteobacteria bacterium]